MKERWLLCSRAGMRRPAFLFPPLLSLSQTLANQMLGRRWHSARGKKISAEFRNFFWVYISTIFSVDNTVKIPVARVHGSKDSTYYQEKLGKLKTDFLKAKRSKLVALDIRRAWAKILFLRAVRICETNLLYLWQNLGQTSTVNFHA